MPPHHYDTGDLYLAAAFLTTGHELAGIAHREERARFLFAPSDALAETARRFYAAQLPVDARTFADNLKALKQAMFAPGTGAGR